MTTEKSFKTICDYLPDEIRTSLLKTESSLVSRLTELRLYCGRGIVLFERERRYFLCRGGAVSGTFSSSAFRVSPVHMKHIVSSISKFSFHSHESELTDGWFVLENGIRAGLCGAFSRGGKGVITDASSVNFRIAREMKCCSQAVADKCFGRSVLICGSVNSGKTTLLRDLCRIYGNSVRCTLVDERNEISALKNGVPLYDVGEMTDIITGRCRHDSIIGSVRTMSPFYIFCDEIADECDVEAVSAAVGCGTKIVATIHADSYSALMKRKTADKLISDGAFDVLVFLERTGIKEVRMLC